MDTKINGAQSTKQTDSSQSKKAKELDQDTKALKTLLALIFSIAATNNHNGSLYAGNRYASYAGQALLMMNNDFQTSSFENLAGKLIDSLGNNRKDLEEKPVSLQDRNSEIKALRSEANSKEAVLKSEIEEVAPELGFKVSNTEEKSSKKTGKKLRSKEYEKAIQALKAEKTSLRLKLQKSQLEGDEKSEQQIRKELDLFKIKERIYHSIPEDQRSKKGSLEKVERTFSGIKEQLGIISDSNTESVRRSFFGLRKTVDQQKTKSKQRAKAVAVEAIRELRAELDLTGDKTLGSMISKLN